ncbi:receptor-like protein eix2 [Quercus suber]|uniref:Receptor-like protein eix2 n=1 Tax=Quercus suber TaxID=58331 RepID=A0AAW0IIH3_QUESU
MVLNLGNNNLSGNIPASMGSLNSLQSLHLYKNKFSWNVTIIIEKLLNLVTIDVAENRFAGNIPSWIGHRCTSLMILNLRSNYFHGHIPKELCALASLQILDLSQISYLEAYLDVLKILAPWPQIIFQMQLEFLSNNGEISHLKTFPRIVYRERSLEVTSLQGLQSLNLSYNLLIGSIPENIGAMGSLESIDFSLNQLSGQVPSSMSSLTFLNHLNLSNNNLTGKIPLSTQLQSLDPSGFIGNKLCGPPLTNSCTTNGVKPNIRSKDTSGLEVDWFYVSMSLGFVVGFGGVCGPLLYNKQWRMMYFQFLDHIGYKLKSVVL